MAFTLKICLAACALSLATAGTSPHQIHCAGEPDGLHEIGCWGYANCVNGVPDVHDCGYGLVLERDTMTCIKPGSGHTDCYLQEECVGKADGTYADHGDHCQTYIRCQGELTLGRLYCPATLHFNQRYGVCDYPANMYAPCGTKGVDPNAPKVTTPMPTMAPTTAMPITAMPTTAIPTTAMPTTSMPTTAMPTTAMPTTAMPTTAMPTAQAPTTAMPTTETRAPTKPSKVKDTTTLVSMITKKTHSPTAQITGSVG